MKRFLRHCLVIVGVTVFTRCATLNVDKARLGGIKKVALAGFVVNQEVPPGFQWGESKGFAGWGVALPKANEHAAEMYTRLGKALRADLKWTLTDRRSLESNRTYKEWFDRSMKGLQNRPPIAANLEALGASGVMDPWPVERMSLEDRQKLMQALGVEALAVATVKIQLEQAGGLKKLIGAGDFKPFAMVSFAVYDGKTSEPVWRDLQAVGDVVEEGTAHVLGITDKQDLMRKSVTAAESSYSKLLARFRQQNG